MAPPVPTNGFLDWSSGTTPSHAAEETMPANPVLTPERFQRESDVNRPGWGAPTGTVTGGTAPGGAGSGGGTPGAATWPEAASAPVERSQAMTIAGTLTATGVLFALILAAGAFGWGQVTQTTQYVDSATGQVVTGPGPGVVVENTTSIPGWMIGSVLVGVGLAFLTAHEPVHALLRHLGLPATPPPLSPARGPPQPDLGSDPEPDLEFDQTPAFDPAEPEPVPDFDGADPHPGA